MIELARDYGPSTITLLLLAGTIFMMVRQRGRGGNGQDRRHDAIGALHATVSELRQDVKEIGRDVREIREHLPVIEHRLRDLESR